MKHEVKSVKNQGEVIVDNDRAAPRERNPELDQFRVSARCFTVGNFTVEFFIRATNDRESGQISTLDSPPLLTIMSN